MSLPLGTIARSQEQQQQHQQSGFASLTRGSVAGGHHQQQQQHQQTYGGTEHQLPSASPVVVTVQPRGSQNGFLPPQSMEPTLHPPHHAQQLLPTTVGHHTTLPLSHQNLVSHSSYLPTKIKSHKSDGRERHRRARSKSTESKGRFVKHHGHWYRFMGEEKGGKRHSRHYNNKEAKRKGKGNKTRQRKSGAVDALALYRTEEPRRGDIERGGQLRGGSQRHFQQAQVRAPLLPHYQAYLPVNQPQPQPQFHHHQQQIPRQYHSLQQPQPPHLQNQQPHLVSQHGPNLAISGWRLPSGPRGPGPGGPGGLHPAVPRPVLNSTQGQVPLPAPQAGWSPRPQTGPSMQPVPAHNTSINHPSSNNTQQHHSSQQRPSQGQLPSQGAHPIQQHYPSQQHLPSMVPNTSSSSGSGSLGASSPITVFSRAKEPGNESAGSEYTEYTDSDSDSEFESESDSESESESESEHHGRRDPSRSRQRSSSGRRNRDLSRDRGRRRGRGRGHAGDSRSRDSSRPRSKSRSRTRSKVRRQSRSKARRVSRSCRGETHSYSRSRSRPRSRSYPRKRGTSHSRRRSRSRSRSCSRCQARSPSQFPSQDYNRSHAHQDPRKYHHWSNFPWPDSNGALRRYSPATHQQYRQADPGHVLDRMQNLQISRRNSGYEAVGSYRYLPADRKKRWIVPLADDDDSDEPEVSYVQPVMGSGRGDRGGLSIRGRRSDSVNGNASGISSRGWTEERPHGGDRVGAGVEGVNFPLGSQGHRNPFDPLPMGFPGR